MPHLDTPQSRCRFAIACGDITPPIGIYHRMWGAAAHERAEGIHRPLYAYVAVCEPSDDRADPKTVRTAIVSLDHCLLGREEMEQLLRSLGEQTGYAPFQLLITFTHTHGAGLMSLDRVDLPGGELIPEYLSHVAKTVGDLIQDAQRRLEEVTIVFGQGRCGLAAHRDYFDHASQQWVCGFAPGVAADDTLLVARVTSASGSILATVVNYACHPTTLAWENRLISPDYPGAMRELVESRTGGAPCLFLQGASGELGPREGYVGDPDVADKNGRILGYAALAVLENLPPPRTAFVYQGPVVSGATLGTWRYEPLSEGRLAAISRWERGLDIPWLKYRDDLPTPQDARAELARYQAQEREALGRDDAAAARSARALAERQTRLLRRLAQLPRDCTTTQGGREVAHYPFHIYFWRLGDAVLIGVEGECYSLLQTELRRRFPQTPIFVITLVHGWGPSYVPTRETYGQGIYQESVAVVAPGSLESIINMITSRVDAMLRN